MADANSEDAEGGQVGAPTAPQPSAAQSSEHPSDGGAPPQLSATTGQRQAFRDLRRQLTDDDLASPGVQKLLLDELEKAEAQCEGLQTYVSRYHEADKRSAVLEERQRPATAIDVAFGVGVGVGGAIIGLAPIFWASQPQGWLALIIGFLLVAGATVVRTIRK